MFEYRTLGPISGCIESPAKIGLVFVGENKVVLIDAGSDKDAGRKVRKLLDANGWQLEAILNTHSNADHIGGNAYLQSQTGCAIYASSIEAAFTEHPLLEPSFLYGGYPFAALRHKFLMARPSSVTPIEQMPYSECIEPIELPGHFFNMIGFRISDGTVFLADSLASASTLEKYGIPFVYDVQAYLETIDRIEEMEASLFVPSHAPVTSDIRPLCALNRDKVSEIAERIYNLLKSPMGFEEVLQKLFEAYHLEMNAQQYVLAGSTVRSFLSWLNEKGRIEYCFENSRMIWKRKEETNYVD